MQTTAGDVLGLVEDEGDAAGDEFAGGFVGGHVDEFYGEVEAVGSEDEAVGEKVGVAKGEAAAVADGEQGGTVGAIGLERVVVAVDQRDGFREDEWVHGSGIGGGDADGDKALPGAAGACGAGTDGLEEPGGEMNPALGGSGSDVGFEERSMVRNEWD